MPLHGDADLGPQVQRQPRSGADPVGIPGRSTHGDDEVTDRREHVTITRRGRPTAVLVPVDEHEALEETAEILSEEDALAAIRRGLDDLASHDLIPLDQVRDEHAARGRS